MILRPQTLFTIIRMLVNLWQSSPVAGCLQSWLSRISRCCFFVDDDDHHSHDYAQSIVQLTHLSSSVPYVLDIHPSSPRLVGSSEKVDVSTTPSSSSAEHAKWIMQSLEKVIALLQVSRSIRTFPFSKQALESSPGKKIESYNLKAIIKVPETSKMNATATRTEQPIKVLEKLSKIFHLFRWNNDGRWRRFLLIQSNTKPETQLYS